MKLPKLQLIRSEFKKARTNPLEVQKKVLMQILKENGQTLYGKNHSFSHIRTISEFQENIPLISYETITPYIKKIEQGQQKILTRKKVLFLATTSGTTSKPKHLPVTSERTKQFRKELTLWANYTIKHRPEAIRGKIMYFAGPWKEGITKGGIPFGSISGYMAKQSPLFAKQRMVFPAEVYNILDFDEKMHRMAIIALGTTNISQIGFSSPIEVLQFFDYIEQNRERLITEIVREHPLLAQRLAKLPNFKPRSIWPNLTTINCVMGASQLPYIKLVQKRLDIKTANDPGIYASEGRITLGLSTIPRTGLLVAHENFFEFCEQQEKGFGKPLLIDQLRRGKIYKVIMTTREGLYRYDIGDLIKVVGFKEKLPLVQFVSRDKFLNIVGELSPEQVLLQAVQKIIKQEKMLISGFTFTPYTKEKKKRPQYDLLIESDQDIKQTFADKLEKELQRNILDYKQMRNEFGRLGPLRISQVKSGSYRAFEKQRRGQPKPMIIAPEEFKKQFNIIKIIEAV